MTRKLIMLARTALTVLLLALPSLVMADETPWVDISSEGVMTFHYDGGKIYCGSPYKMDVKTDGSTPKWNSIASTVTKVVFDEDFKNAPITNCNKWFKGMTNLKTLEGLENFNTSCVTNMSEMFQDCSSIDTLNLYNFDTQNLTNTTEMFYGCSNIKYIFVSDKFVISKVTESGDMFEGCTSLTNYNAKSESQDARHAKDIAEADNEGYFYNFDKKEKVLWVEYQADNKKLVFHYDKLKDFTAVENKLDVAVPSGESDETLYPETTWKQYAENITKVVFLEEVKDARPTYCAKWFSNMQNLTKIEGFEYLNTSEVTSMFEMFRDCYGMKVLDLRNFDTKNVTSMGYMFRNSKNLKHIIVSDSFVVPQDDYKSYQMFVFCSKLPNYNAQVNNYTYAKDVSEGGCLNYWDKLPETAWVEYNDETKTLSFRYDKMNDLTDTDNYSISGLTTQMMTPIDVPGWVAHAEDVEKAVVSEDFKDQMPETCYKWFYGMKNLKSIEGLKNLNTADVTSMREMFSGCEQITTLDLTSFDTKCVRAMKEMFKGCSALTDIIVGDNFTTDRLSDEDDSDNIRDKGTDMFLGCEALTNYNSENVGKEYAKYLRNGGYFTCFSKAVWAKYDSDNATVTYYYDGKRGTEADNCYEYSPIKEYWCGKEHEGKEVDVVLDPSMAEWTTTDMTYLFKIATVNQKDNAFKMKSLTGLEYLNTAGVVRMKHMFAGSGAAELDLSCFKTDSVTDMNGMFRNCTLTSLDLTSFNTANVTKMAEMFFGDSKLTHIYVSENFTVDKVVDSNNMFWQSRLPNYKSEGRSTLGKPFANFTSKGCLTLRKHFKIGDKVYNIDGYKDGSDTYKLTCNDDVEFTDGEAYSADDIFYFDGATASYTRQMKDKWGTVCLPFGVDVSSSTLPSNSCWFYEIGGIKDDIVEMYSPFGLSSQTTPGMPYLICKKDLSNDEMKIATTYTRVVTATVNHHIEGSTTPYLEGAFEDTYLAEAGDYVFDNNKFYKVDDIFSEGKTVKVAPYHAYLTFPEETGDKYGSVISVEKDEETNYIKNLVDGLNNVGNGAEIYDASGRRTDTLQKGLNIVKNGGKTVKVMMK